MIRSSHTTRLLFLLIGLSTVHSIANAEDWPVWRGVGRDDISSTASGYTDGQWPLTERWREKVGLGCTTPVVVGERLFVLGWEDKADTLSCLDLSTGNLLWKQSDPGPDYGRHAIGDKGLYRGPSACPEFDAETGYLYTMGTDGDLRCRDTNDSGREVWAINLYDRFRVERRPNVGRSRRMHRDYGYVTAPIVWNDWLLVEVGAASGNLIAFHKRTGKQLWTSENTDPAGHSGSPVPMTVEGIPCVVVLTIKNLVVTRLDSGHVGKTVAEFKWTTDFANNIPTPAVHENSVLVTSAYNNYAMARVDVTLDGAKQVWRSDSCSGVCSPVIHDGSIYWAWRGIHCLDFETGKQRWRGNGVGTAGSCLMTADDRLVVLADRGELYLVETAGRSPDKFTELARRKKMFPADAWPHVVLVEGSLVCKDRLGNLVVFDMNTGK